MLAVLIALLIGSFAGLCAGVWLIASQYRQPAGSCRTCGRAWQLHPDQHHGSSAVRIIENTDVHVELFDAPNDN